MIRVIRALKPKVFLFENVQGLLNSKWSEGSKKVKIWPILLNAFASLPEYTVRPTTVHAYDYGVPQNRPRVLLVGIRDDSLPFSKTTYADDAIRAGFLGKTAKAPDLVNLWGDLLDDQYDFDLKTDNYPHDAVHNVQRRCGALGEMRKKGAPLYEQEYSNHKDFIKEKFQYMIDNRVKSIKELPEEFRTKKSFLKE